MNLTSGWVDLLDIFAQLMKTRQCEILTQIRENTGDLVDLVDLYEEVMLALFHPCISGAPTLFQGKAGKIISTACPLVTCFLTLSMKKDLPAHPVTGPSSLDWLC